MNEYADNACPEQESPEVEEEDEFIDRLAEQANYGEILELPEDWKVVTA